MVLMELLQGDLGLKAHLSFHADIDQDAAIIVPLTDAVEVAGAALIVDDEGYDIVTEAFLEHQQATDTTVAILEGADTLKLHVEIQNLMEADICLRFVLLEQLSEC